MKKIFTLLILPFFSFAQDYEMQDLCLGNAAAGSEVFTIYPTRIITTFNSKTDEVKKCKAVIMNDNKNSYCTVLTVKLTESKYISFAYAPGQSKKIFNGYGEFCMAINDGINVEKTAYFSAPLKNTIYNGKQVESLKKGNYEVIISDKFEVVAFFIDGIGYSMPANYFEYK